LDRNRTISPRTGVKHPAFQRRQSRNGLRFQARQEFSAVAFEMHFSGLSLCECGDWRRGRPRFYSAPNRFSVFVGRWSVWLEKHCPHHRQKTEGGIHDRSEAIGRCLP
jgi:hypothetical protein